MLARWHLLLMLSFEDGKDSKESQDEHDDAESGAESKHMIMNDI